MEMDETNVLADDQETPDLNFIEETPNLDFSNDESDRNVHDTEIDDLDEPDQYTEDPELEAATEQSDPGDENDSGNTNATGTMVISIAHFKTKFQLVVFLI